MAIFQNISKSRDIFYGEMSKLNHNSYEALSKLEKQHSNSLVDEGTIKQQQMLFGHLFLGSNIYVLALLAHQSLCIFLKEWEEICVSKWRRANISTCPV